MLAKSRMISNPLSGKVSSGTPTLHTTSNSWASPRPETLADSVSMDAGKWRIWTLFCPSCVSTSNEGSRQKLSHEMIYRRLVGLRRQRRLRRPRRQRRNGWCTHRQRDLEGPDDLCLLGLEESDRLNGVLRSIDLDERRHGWG